MAVIRAMAPLRWCQISATACGPASSPARLRARSTAEWLEVLAALDVPAAAYNTLEALIDDPHLRDVGFFGREDHPSEGPIRRTAVPNRFGGGMRQDHLPAPRLGEHTEAVLREAGYAEGEIAALMRDGAARGAGPAAPAR